VLKILYRSWQLHLIFLILVNFTSSAHHASPASHFYPSAHTYPDTRRRLPMHLSRHFPPLLCSGVSTRQFVPTVIHGTFYRPRTNSVLCEFSGEDMHLRLIVYISSSIPSLSRVQNPNLNVCLGSQYIDEPYIWNRYLLMVSCV
jgi:hypothetical protein